MNFCWYVSVCLPVSVCRYVSVCLLVSVSLWLGLMCPCNYDCVTCALSIVFVLCFQRFVSGVQMFLFGLSDVCFGYVLMFVLCIQMFGVYQECCSLSPLLSRWPV